MPPATRAIDALAVLRNAKEATIIEDHGDGVYIAEAGGQKEVVVPRVPVHVGMKGKLLDTGDGMKIFLAPPTEGD